MHYKKTWLVLSMVAVLSACGGGSSNDDTNPTDGQVDNGGDDGSALVLTQAMLTANSWYSVEHDDTYAGCTGKFEFSRNNVLSVSFIEEGVLESVEVSYELDSEGRMSIPYSADVHTLRSFDTTQMVTTFVNPNWGHEEDEEVFMSMNWFMIRDEAIEFASELGLSCGEIFPG